jgi:hypothetical protein
VAEVLRNQDDVQRNVIQESHLHKDTKQWLLNEFSRHETDGIKDTAAPKSPNRHELSRVTSEAMLRKGEVQKLLEKVDSFSEFNIWALAEASDGHPLQTLGWFLMHRSVIV